VILRQDTTSKLMVSQEKLSANRKNAAKSSGPRSASGKVVASQNARKHGVLSARLFVQGEVPEEFDALLQSLVQDLRPVGALELLLVERIAVAIWKQCRLNQAESTTINLARNPELAAIRQSNSTPLAMVSDKRQAQVDLFSPQEYSRFLWATDMYRIATAAQQFRLTPQELQRQFPKLWKQAMETSKTDPDVTDPQSMEFFSGATPEERVESFLANISLYAHELIGELEPRFKRFVQAYQQTSGSVLPDNIDLMTRYQTALDNDLYKALRSLREAQSWRLKTVEAVPTVVKEGSASG
jgi:hypothetical protein